MENQQQNNNNRQTAHVRSVSRVENDFRVRLVELCVSLWGNTSTATGFAIQITCCAANGRGDGVDLSVSWCGVSGQFELNSNLWLCVDGEDSQ